MNSFFVVLLFGFLGFSNAKAEQPISSYALTPSFHFISAVKTGADGSCITDGDRSVNFTELFGRSHSALGNLRLNIYEAPNDQKRVKLVGVTLDKSATVEVSFITSTEGVAYLEQYWVNAPKRRWFAATEDAACVGGDLQYNLISQFSKTLR